MRQYPMVNAIARNNSDAQRPQKQRFRHTRRAYGKSLEQLRAKVESADSAATTASNLSRPTSCRSDRVGKAGASKRFEEISVGRRPSP